MQSPMRGVVLEPIDGMFLLLEGAAQAVKKYDRDDGKVVYDYRVGKDELGDYFGEATLLGADERGATIRAIGHTRVIHLDTKACARLRAGKVDKMMCQHYLKELESEHRVLVDLHRVEECSELYTVIEAFARDNELPMPKLMKADQLVKFRPAGTVSKAAVKRRVRRASVEQARGEESADEDEDARMLREMREGESKSERAKRERVAKSLAHNKARARRASVDLVVAEDEGSAKESFNPAKQTQQNNTETKDRSFRGRRRSVEWDDPTSPAATPVDSPTAAGKEKLLRSQSHRGRRRSVEWDGDETTLVDAASSAGKVKTQSHRGRRRSVEWDGDGTTLVDGASTAGKEKQLRSQSHYAPSSSVQREKDDRKLRSRSHSSKHKESEATSKTDSSNSGDQEGSPKARRRRASVQNWERLRAVQDAKELGV